MIRSILVILAVIAIIYAIRHIRQQPAEKRPRLVLKYGLYLLAIIAIIMVITGKLHWIAAGIAALLPVVQKLFFAAMRFLPFMSAFQASRQQSGKQQEQGQSRQSAGYQGGKMTVEQAREIFGSEHIATADQVVKRHRELMQKNHPDRGGSDYLAAQINQAKDVLLEHLKT